MIDHTLNKAVSGNEEFLISRIKQLDPTKRWQVKAVEYKSKRSIEQNDRLWKLYTDLGKYIGEDDPEEVHKLMGYKFLRYPKTVNGEQFWFIKSTTKLNTTEMTEYQESIERWGASLGFVWGGE
jgi:hypothetical protein